jgi:hypothetical protein
VQRIWKASSTYAVGVVGTLLLIDLFLPWHEASVSLAGAVVVSASSSAWAGWRALAGVILIAMLIWEGLRIAGVSLASNIGARTTTFVLALFVALFTTIEFVAGTSSVAAGGVVFVGVHGRQWPAYVGLTLAALLIIAAFAEVGNVTERPARRLGLGVR